MVFKILVFIHGFLLYSSPIFIWYATLISSVTVGKKLLRIPLDLYFIVHAMLGFYTRVFTVQFPNIHMVYVTLISSVTVGKKLLRIPLDLYFIVHAMLGFYTRVFTVQFPNIHMVRNLDFQCNCWEKIVKNTP